MRLFHSLKSTHWVVWSSPLLLLVLVFTLTTSSSSAPRRHGAAMGPATLLTTTTYLHEMTSSSVTSTSIAMNPSTTTTTFVSTPRRRAISSPSETNATIATNATSGVHSSSVTASSDKPVANAPAESVSSGVLTGRLTATFVAADVPLVGPGTWNVASSSPVTLRLRCANQTIGVEAQFVLGAAERCQLTIVSLTPRTTLTWQLTPNT